MARLDEDVRPGDRAAERRLITRVVRDLSLAALSVPATLVIGARVLAPQWDTDQFCTGYSSALLPMLIVGAWISRRGYRPARIEADAAELERSFAGAQEGRTDRRRQRP